MPFFNKLEKEKKKNHLKIKRNKLLLNCLNFWIYKRIMENVTDKPR